MDKMEERLLRILEKRGTKAFIVLPSAEVPFILHRRRNGALPASPGRRDG